MKTKAITVRTIGILCLAWTACDIASGVQQHAVRRSEVKFRIALQERFSIIDKCMIDLIQNVANAASTLIIFWRSGEPPEPVRRSRFTVLLIMRSIN